METAQVIEKEVKEVPSQGAQTPAFQAPKKKRRWVKPLVIVLIVTAALGWFVVRPMLTAGKGMLAGAYLTEQAQVRDMTVSVSSTGTVTPIDSYKVTALVTGEVLVPLLEGGVQHLRMVSRAVSLWLAHRTIPSLRCQGISIFLPSASVTALFR